MMSQGEHQVNLQVKGGVALGSPVSRSESLRAVGYLGDVEPPLGSQIEVQSR